MISLDDAFAKFKSRLELNDREQKDVSNRHYEVRDHVKAAFCVDRDILTGSYARYTKTKPLKDVDIFFILNNDEEGHYRDRQPTDLLEALRSALATQYGEGQVDTERRCVTIDFNVRGQEDRVLSIDAVPAYADGDHYIIPDPWIEEGWTRTDPERHAVLTTEANKAFSGQWKPMVKMLKKWNEHHDKPVKPSFLVEVMALDILYPPFSGGYVYELKGFFATAAQRIRETWDDPAGLGPPVSDRMDTAQCDVAQGMLEEARRYVDRAIQLKRQGKNGDALRVWRDDIFGPLFPLS